MNRRVEKINWEQALTFIEVIYKNNPYMSPYQSREFLSIVRLGRQDTNLFSTYKYHSVNWVLYRDDKPICVAPCFFAKTANKVKIILAGMLTSAGHLDFVYIPDYSYEDHVFLMNTIKAEFSNNCEFFFDRISNSSLIYKYESIENADKMLPSKMVTIPLPSTYDEWYQSLSKSVRQNIRTTYNRLNTDGKEISFQLYTANNLPTEREKKDMMKLFCRRLCEHSKKSRFVLEKILYLLKKKNPMTLGIDKHPHYIGATVYIKDETKEECVAFFSGIIGNTGKILVPRLAINMDYGRYSPGALLINETMKAIITEDRQYSEFDLQRGDEPYKYSYGGKEYFNYEWID